MFSIEALFAIMILFFFGSHRSFFFLILVLIFIMTNNRYMDEFDQMAQMYIQQMTERHAMALLEFQKQLRQELAGKVSSAR